MKLSVIEWAVLALTGLFLTFTVGYFAGTQQAGTVTAAGTVTVQTETTPVSAETTEETEEAETETMELSEPVAASETAEPEPAESEEPDTVLVNINTADAAALEALPGIGEELAARIVAYREENGPFQFAEDITNVYGIGDGKYASIADYITVGE
jgi:competence protein ComEA